MLILRRAAELRAALAQRDPGPGAHRAGTARVGLVPTMGALHDGHVSLLRAARSGCDVVVMSLFVNPTQFDEGGDLAAYPRDEAGDLRAAREAGADIVFAPDVGEVYPDGFATTVTVGGPAAPLEGVVRGPGHFAGVATVVLKLLLLVEPDVAYFGQKDAQQIAVVRRLVTDLGLRVEIAARPTVRDPRGLALSSRNVRLNNDERERATALHRALEATRAALAAGETDPERATAPGRAELARAGAEVDYLEIVDPASMARLERVDGDALVLVAARIGGVRLIDNLPCPARTPRPKPATRTGAPTV